MDSKNELFGHTIEMRTSGSGSIDPWSSDYGKSIGVSLMGTCDVRDFLLIDGNHIYRFERSRDTIELFNLISNNIFDSWEMFEDKWLKPNLEKQWGLEDWGSLEKRKRDLDGLKLRSDVWKTIPEKKKREVYEYLKTLSEKEREEWYKNKISELEK